MDALWVSDDMADLIAPLFTMPRQAGDDLMTAKVYRIAVSGLPYASVSHAVQHFLFENPSQKFLPTSALFRQTVEDHAKSIKLKLKHLAQAIANEEGET